MELKNTVDSLLKTQNRSLRWLAKEMGKTFDGLKLSLIKGSIKYIDIIKMSEILNVSPSYFFDEEQNTTKAFEEEPVYYGLRNELEACKELAGILKNQLKDKEKIIRLLDKS